MSQIVEETVQTNIPARKVEQSDNQAPYFKLPVKGLLKRLPKKFNFTEFNPSQQAMFEGLENHRFWCHVSARRTGKSSAAAVLALLKILEPNQQVMVISPNFNLSTIIWDYVIDLIEEFKLETPVKNVKDRVIKLVNGSTLRLLSAKNRTSLVGRAANLIIVDEAALIPDPEYFERDLRPAMSTFKDSRCLFISTPRGKQNYMYDYYQKGQDKDKFPSWGSGKFPWHANPALSREDIEEAEQLLTSSIFRQEYYCDWLTYEGQIYKLDDEKHLINLTGVDAPFRIEPGDENFEVIAGLDVGFRDATAFIVLATDGEHWYVVDSYSAEEGTTSTHASYIKELVDKWDIELIYIDSAAQQSKADLAYDYDIYCTNAIKSVNEGIASIQVLVEKDKLLFDEYNATEPFASLAAYRWNIKTELQKPLHDKNCHYADALRYAIYTYTKTSSISVYSLPR